ncbi:MAG: zinc-binding alcohol dehydrogenase family protein [Acetivibrionales bacterium]
MPEPKEGQALVKVIQAGICGGEVHYYDGTSPYCNYPQIYGHEMVGEVVKVMGESDLKPGDIITAEILLPCGTCYACRHGKINCCINMKVIGAQTQGAFAEYIVYPIKNLHKIPPELSIDDAVLVEPYSIGYHVVKRSQIQSGDTALVFGTGTIGLTIIDVLKSKGISVIAVDISDKRLEKAISIGADHTINARTENALEKVLELTGGDGAGTVFEATGNAKVISDTINYVAAGGVIVIAGITGSTVEFNGLLITRKELSILGSRNAAGDFEPVIQLMKEGRLNQRKLITGKFPMDQAAKAFELLHTDPHSQIKVVIEMHKK